MILMMQEAIPMTNRDRSCRTKLVFRRSSRLTTVAVCLAVALSMVTLLALHAATAANRQKAEELRAQAAQLEQKNDGLEQKLGILGTLESARQIAMEFLGLVDPDTVIIEPEN